MKYFNELKKAMLLLSEHPKTIFIGQSILYGGTGLYDSLVDVPDNKKIEFPVSEYLQSGVVNGIAIEGLIPISIYPRWNFLLMSVDQIVNHLDKFITMSDGECKPHVIIRVSVGSVNIIDPQDQHKGNFSQSFRDMLENIEVVELIEPEDILPAYKKALNRDDGVSTILVEYSDFCYEK